MGGPWEATKPNSILNWRLKLWKIQWLIVVLTMGLAWTGGLQKWLFIVSKPATLFYQFRLKFLVIFDSINNLVSIGSFVFTLLSRSPRGRLGVTEFVPLSCFVSDISRELLKLQYLNTDLSKSWFYASFFLQNKRDGDTNGKPTNHKISYYYSIQNTFCSF